MNGWLLSNISKNNYFTEFSPGINLFSLSFLKLCWNSNNNMIMWQKNTEPVVLGKSFLIKKDSVNQKLDISIKFH